MAFLVLFSTSVPVYDGERLFLHVFPAWALLIGLGFAFALEPLPFGTPFGRRSESFWSASCWSRPTASSLHPFGLSYYNGLIGGLAGAERLGLELTYWNDPVDQVLLDRLAREGQAGRRRRRWCRRSTRSRES